MSVMLNVRPSGPHFLRGCGKVVALAVAALAVVALAVVAVVELPAAVEAAEVAAVSAVSAVAAVRLPAVGLLAELVVEAEGEISFQFVNVPPSLRHSTTQILILE